MTKVLKSVRREITKRYEKMVKTIDKADVEDNTGRINCYQCNSCGKITKTIERVKGVTPFGIICPHCGGDAMSTFYQDRASEKPIEYEWVRPTLEDCIALAEQPFQLNHFLEGGLKRQKIE